MEEIGVVIKTTGGIARVSIENKQGLCATCSMGTCVVSGATAELDALNRVGAKEGQKVRVFLRPYSYIKGSIIVYAIPVLSLVAGAVLGKEFFSTLDYFKAMDPEIVSAIFGFSAFALSFLFVKLWSMRADKRTEYKPVIEEILE